VTGRLSLLIRRFGNWLFQAEDARARQHGWEITVDRGGLARTYRDPRFDRFRRCPSCDGTGACRNREPCGLCAGTGRITLAERSLTDRGRAQ
jgi:RecJ-like exonuclease